MRERIRDLRHFHYAIASAEHGSFRRAAAALNVQQSTVSRGVQSLEHHIGAELFERGHAGIRPTSAGYQFLAEASLGFDHLERAMQRAGAIQRCEYGELMVGASVPLALFGDAFELFRKEYGGVTVEVVESTTPAISMLIQQRKLDVAFVVLPKSHPLASACGLVLEDLCRERIILSSGGPGPDIADHLARRMAKFEVGPNVQMHGVGQFNLINMVAREFGVTIVVGPLPGNDFDGVVSIPLAGRNVAPLYAVWKECNPNPALKGLLRILRGPERPGSAS
jgi:DNA-binding transcriptional LysR family regulator